MIQSNKQTQLVSQLIALKSQKLKNGKLSTPKQIKHDQLVSQISDFSEKSCRKVAKIMKKNNCDKFLKIKSSKIGVND